MRSSNTPMVAVAALAVSLGLAFAATAQTAPRDSVTALLDTPSASAQATVSDRASEPETDETRITRALNAEVTAQYELSQNQTQADREAEYRRRAEMADQYSAANAETEARNAEALRQAADLQAQYELAMADWRATVRACEVGDRARCRAGSLTPNAGPPAVMSQPGPR